MEKKAIILHIGTHKTATSSMQDALKNSLSLLKTLGYYYLNRLHTKSEVKIHTYNKANHKMLKRTGKNANRKHK